MRKQVRTCLANESAKLYKKKLNYSGVNFLLHSHSSNEVLMGIISLGKSDSYCEEMRILGKGC